MGKILYVVQWLLDECNEEHQNIDIRTLDKQVLAELVSEALEAWDGGARDVASRQATPWIVAVKIEEK